MAEKLANLNKGGSGGSGAWKYLTQVTGATEVTLPSKFNELFVKVVGTHSGYTRVYNFHFIYDALPNTMSTTEYYNIGFGFTGGAQCYASAFCGKNKYQTNAFMEMEANILSTTVTTVYYR